MGSYIYNNHEYSSVRQIADAFNINVGTLAKRLELGWDLKDAIEKPVKSMSCETEYKGVVYPSIAELARAYDMDVELVQSRVDLGWDIETALNTPVKQHKIEVIYKDKKYDSISELASELDIPYSILAHHYYKTQEINAAIEKSHASMSREKPTAWNKQYDSYSQVAIAYGVRLHNLIRQLNKGVKMEDAILYLLDTEKIKFQGMEYNSLIELAAAYKIQPSNVRGRITQGWTLEEALTRTIRRSPGLNTEYRGKEYISQVALCRDYGISIDCVREQLRTHDSLSFMKMFEVFVKTKEKCMIPYDEQVNLIPRCVINGKIYNQLNDFASEINISSAIISTLKFRVGANDLIDALKQMQSKTVVRYLYNDEIVQSKDLKKILSSRQIKRMANNKIYVPMYPTLQGYDFTDRCFDSYRIFFDFLSEAEMSIAENIEDDQYEEGKGITMGGI